MAQTYPLSNLARVQNSVLSSAGLDLGHLLDLVATTKTRLDTDFDSGTVEADLKTEYDAEQSANPDDGIPATYTAVNRAGTAWTSTAAIERSSNPMGGFHNLYTWMEKLAEPTFLRTSAQVAGVDYHTIRQVAEIRDDIQTFYDLYATLDARFQV